MTHTKNKWDAVIECPEWPLVGSYNPEGRLGTAQLEVFAERSGEQATHAHFYMELDEARDMFRREGPRLKEFFSHHAIKTVSFK